GRAAGQQGVGEGGAAVVLQRAEPGVAADQVVVRVDEAGKRIPCIAGDNGVPGGERAKVVNAAADMGRVAAHGGVGQRERAVVENAAAVVLTAHTKLGSQPLGAVGADGGVVQRDRAEVVENTAAVGDAAKNIVTLTHGVVEGDGGVVQR